MDTNKESSRKDFIKMLTKSLGATLTNHPVLDALMGNDEVLKLNPEQQAFMLEYGKWMDQNIEVIKLQKQDPDNILHRKAMMELTEKAAAMQPQLIEFMKDRNFALIYHASIQKMRDEIEE